MFKEFIVFMSELSAKDRQTIIAQDYYMPEYDFENEIIKP